MITVLSVDPSLLITSNLLLLFLTLGSLVCIGYAISADIKKRCIEMKNKNWEKTTAKVIRKNSRTGQTVIRYIAFNKTYEKEIPCTDKSEVEVVYNLKKTQQMLLCDIKPLKKRKRKLLIIAAVLFVIGVAQLSWVVYEYAEIFKAIRDGRINC